jgi:hypothetical protein
MTEGRDFADPVQVLQRSDFSKRGSRHGLSPCATIGDSLTQAMLQRNKRVLGSLYDRRKFAGKFDIAPQQEKRHF